jgi:hypothetical protein
MHSKENRELEGNLRGMRTDAALRLIGFTRTDPAGNTAPTPTDSFCARPGASNLCEKANCYDTCAKNSSLKSLKAKPVWHHNRQTRRDFRKDGSQTCARARKS